MSKVTHSRIKKTTTKIIAEINKSNMERFMELQERKKEIPRLAQER